MARRFASRFFGMGVGEVRTAARGDAEAAGEVCVIAEGGGSFHGTSSSLSRDGDGDVVSRNESCGPSTVSSKRNFFSGDRSGAGDGVNDRRTGGVIVGVAVGVDAGVGIGVNVDVDRGVAVAVGRGVGVEVGVGVRDGDGEGIGVGNSNVSVSVGATVGVSVGSFFGVGVGVGV